MKSKRLARNTILAFATDHHASHRRSRENHSCAPTPSAQSILTHPQFPPLAISALLSMFGCQQTLLICISSGQARTDVNGGSPVDFDDFEDPIASESSAWRC